MLKELVELLSKMGFSSNIIKAYIELIRSKEPITAYELSKKSSIPLSKIYEVVGHLVSKGLVYEVPGKPKRYKVFEPKVALSNILFEEKSRIESLFSFLDDIKLPATTSSKMFIYKGDARYTVFYNDLSNSKKYSYSFIQSLPPIEHPLSKLIEKKLKEGVDIKGIIVPNDKNKMIRDIWNEKFPGVYKTSDRIIESRMGVIDDKIVRFTLASDGELVMVRIEDEAIARLFKDGFLNEWKRLE